MAACVTCCFPASGIELFVVWNATSSSGGIGIGWYPVSEEIVCRTVVWGSS